ADLMPRNLDTRVELLTPVRSEALQSEIEDTLERYLGDDRFAWELEPDGTWRRRQGGERGAHAELMARAAERQAEAVAPAPETAATAR
ncbi:MAG: Polyphosphate kinase, partial [uncultured Phycisphaerae bacterium]